MSLRICLIIPPNEGILGGIGRVRDVDGKVREVPLFPKPEGVEIVSIKGKRLRGSVPPLGILYVAALLEDAGMDVELLDFQGGQFILDDLVEAIHRCDRAGISAITGSDEAVTFICRLIGKLKPDLPIIVGGPDATINPERYQDIATVVFQGEAGTRAAKAFADPHASLQLAAEPADEITLDTYPRPARHLVNHRLYKMMGVKAGSIIAGQGCPHHCTYCGRSKLLCFSYRSRDPKQVLDELEEMYDLGYRFVGFADDNLMGRVGFAEEIWQGIIDRKIRMLSVVSLSVHRANAESYRLARDAGVIAMSFGFESSSDSTLKTYRKGATVADNEHAARLADEAGIFVKGNFILGGPCEERSDIIQLLSWIEQQPIDYAHFSMLSYVKGSALWHQAVERGLVQETECSVRASAERGLSPLSERELTSLYKTALASQSLWYNPKLWLRRAQKLVRPKNRELIPMAARAAISYLCS